MWAAGVLYSATLFCVGPPVINLVLGGRATDAIGKTPLVVTPQGAAFQYISFVLVIAMFVLYLIDRQRSIFQTTIPKALCLGMLGVVTVAATLSAERIGLTLSIVVLLASSITLIDSSRSFDETFARIATFYISATALSAAMPAAWMGSLSFVSQSDKALLGTNVLAGLQNHSNNLGMSVCLAIPLLYISPKRTVWQHLWCLVGLCVLVLSGSRTSMISGAAVFVLVCLSLLMTTRRAKNLFFYVAFACITTINFVLPFANSDPFAFTERGFVWDAGIRAWHSAPLLGQGLGAFGNHTIVERILNRAPSHGHNQMITLLASGGLILTVLWVVIALLAMSTSLAKCSLGATAFVLVILCLGVTETPIRMDVFDEYGFISILPLIYLASRNTQFFNRKPGNLDVHGGSRISLLASESK